MQVPFELPLTHGLRSKKRWEPATMYRLSKTNPEQQPIPRIQDILNGLGGNKWFTVLDQGKAYHQGLMAEVAPLLHF